MAEDKLAKNDIAAVFKRLRGIPGNKVCFDCGAKNPTWASVTYGVFICIDCSAVHRSLGVHLSFVRSTQLDTWTWLQLRAMQVGGNANALSFFHQHGVTSTDAQQKYNSRTAQMYREKLHQLATAAIRSHGTKLHIELPHAETATSPSKKEVDFFEDITQAHISSPSSNSLQNGSANNFNNNQNNDYNKEESLLCPKVDALNISPSDGQIRTDVRKSTITGRKASSNKKTLGGRIGLGAQKVSTNFTDIEKEAQRIDELRRQTEKIETEKSEKSQADEDLQRASIRLAYKDISQRQKEAENKMKNLDPRKAEQMERLGIGFGTNNTRSSNAVSHSVASEMKLITQENVKEPSKTSDLDLEDDFEFFSFTSGPPKYGDSPFLTRSASDRLGDFSGKSSWSSDRQDKKTTSEIMPSPQKDTSGRSRKFTPVASPVTDEAQKKFGNARAISSEQYFGPNRDLDFERRTNLTRFEGSNSISSEDYFGGNGSVPRSASASSFSGPNLYEIKEGVRDGVTKVAGRLSSLANGMMNSIQDRYGI